MAFLAESPDYPEGIYQIETTDPVVGGAEGTSNRPLKQLASRTAWLKQQMDTLLSELGDLQIDGIPELQNILNAKAPLDSPLLTGSPGAPTPAQFDSDANLATTAFVQRALGNYRGSKLINGISYQIPVHEAGIIYDVLGTTTLNMPDIDLVPDGACYTVWANTTSLTINDAKGKLVQFTGNEVNSVTITGYSVITLTKSAHYGFWLVNREGAGVASFVNNGYQRFPSGLIMQWGRGIASTVQPLPSTGYQNILPIAFPNTGLFASAIHYGGDSQNTNIICNELTTTRVNFESAYTLDDISIRYIALGY